MDSHCLSCNKKVPEDAKFCPYCRAEQEMGSDEASSYIPGEAESSNSAFPKSCNNNEPVGEKNKKTSKILKLEFAVASVLLLLNIGYVRVYHGSDTFKVVAKESFSLKDTIVNTDDLLGLFVVVNV